MIDLQSAHPCYIWICTRREKWCKGFCPCKWNSWNYSLLFQIFGYCHCYSTGFFTAICSGRILLRYCTSLLPPGKRRVV